MGVGFFSFSAITCAQTSTVKDKDGNVYEVKKLADGKLWIVDNLKTDLPGSHCYEDKQSNCDKYGRLYTWNQAIEGCKQLGDGWKLPTNEDWQKMLKQYGGVRDDAEDGGKAAFEALYIGGSSKFDAVLGGGRNPAGDYARIDAHGFYWTSTASNSANAWIYNFGTNMRIVNRHDDSEKVREVAVRCFKE